MIGQNLLLVLMAATFVAYSTPAKTGLADPVAEVATQSRELADAGEWDKARTVLEDKLSLAAEASLTALFINATL